MSNFDERRKKVLSSMEDNSLLFVFSSSAPYSVGDEKHPFAVDRNFFYLTGLNIENAILVLRKAMGVETATLYIERFDELMAKWVGPRMLASEATAISGIERVSYIDEFEASVVSQLRVCSRYDAICYFDFEKQELSQITEAINFANKLKGIYPNIVLKNCFNMLAELRCVKDEAEIADMRKAIEITKRGLERVMKTLSPEKYEYQIEAEFNYSLLNEGCREFAFSTIAAAGKNATTLHYRANDSLIGSNDLMLFDLGASYNHYSADISRTYPANGKYSDEQKKIYNIVLGCNEYIIDNIKPGMTLAKLNQMSVEYLEKNCKEQGVLKEGKTIRDYYFHSIGHMLGLETHDVTIPGYILREGNVITVEPGLYIEELGIGIRIEDDVLVTKDGHEVLSKDLIKTIEDIEEFMKKED